METSLKLRNILIITFVVAGTVSLFSAKMQNIQWIDEGGIHKKFFHPYMQSFMMFFGQALCLITFAIMRNKNSLKYQLEAKKALEQGKPPVPLHLIIVPAACDFLSSGLQYIGLNFIPPSIYQMLKGGGIITTFIFSYILIRPRVKRSQLSGCALALIGISLVGVAALLFNNSSSDFSSKDILVGCIIMLISLVANGFFYSFEQKIFKNYYVSPLFMVGMQGVFGMIISGAAIAALTFIPCSFEVKSCAIASNGKAFMQRPQQYFRQIGQNPLLASMVFLTVFAIAFFNFIGLSITKYINALARAILNLTKTALIWIIGIIVTLTAGKTNSNYKWQIIGWQVILIESIGFAFLIFATLIYNENIWIPYLSDPKPTTLLIGTEKQSLLSQKSEDFAN